MLGRIYASCNSNSNYNNTMTSMRRTGEQLRRFKQLGRRQTSSSRFFVVMIMIMLSVTVFAWMLIVSRFVIFVDVDGPSAGGTSSARRLLVAATLISGKSGSGQLDGSTAVISPDKKASVVNFTMISKRKVPHGPDPIHNRRAGNSMHPPRKSLP